MCRTLTTLLCLLVAGFASAEPAAHSAVRHPNVASLSKNSREIFTTSMEWGDRAWDAASDLEHAPPSADPGPHAQPGHLLVKESTWYALGLLLRDRPGDRDRAASVIRAVLKQQYDEPGKRWDGTFRRYPQEPEPGPASKPGIEYDPNWREFVGTTLAIILTEYPERLPHKLAADMLASINHAVEGEMKERRLTPSYTNIALMYGFLWDFAAVKSGRADWGNSAAEWQESVYRLFKQHDSFEEYNSPTYAGVDLYALALYRDYGSTPHMRGIGAEMEGSLWRAMADFYNANLRNVSGPYDRSYGMDMQRYVSVVGLWLRTVLPATEAPLPSFDAPVADHVGDLWIVPALVVLDSDIPTDALAKFRHFPGEHTVRRQITDRRIATAWIGTNLIYGGESTEQTKGVDERSQFHPVTSQWKMPDGSIGWIQLTQCPPIDAVAEKGTITISTSGDVIFRVSAATLDPSMLTQNKWSLPGLKVSVETDAASFRVEQRGVFTDITYTQVSRMVLRLE